MKKIYKSPEVTVKKFETSDIITQSGEKFSAFANLVKDPLGSVAWESKTIDY